MQYSPAASSSSTYATQQHYTTMYAPTPQKGPQAPWAASADPRSVPTPPISNQPRKKSRVSTTPDCYYRTVTSPQDFDPKGIKEEPRARVPYDIDSIAGYPAGDAQDAFLGPPAEDYWYQARDDGRRTPAGNNYSTSAQMRVSKSYSRETTEPPREYSYNSDSAEPRATPTETRTQYITCGRAHSEFPEAEASWGPRSLGNLPASSEASVAAAQLAVTELFPELQESYNAPLDQSQARRYYPQQYTTSTGITPPRRFSPATVDPSLTGSISPYRTRSPSHDGRPRSEYPSASPESLHLYGPTARSSPAHRSSSSYTYANTLVEDDYDSEYDETDEDEDLLSAIPIRIESPNRYFESSASPEVEPITPLGSKYSSPEFSTASSHTMHPPRKESSTGSAPRRMRKAGMPAPPPPTNNAPPPTTTIGAADSAQYEENDALLVQYRRMGISYKTIKTRLNLDEAESTLRGRYRTLTKPKNERLRKPVWSEDDIALLLNIVDPDLPHIKWKQVSDTIVTRGGTYRFGSSTCKKQYLALVGEGRAQPLNEGVSTSKRRKHRSLKNGS